MIRIITDSTSDLSPARARELNIDVVPLQVLFGQEAFLDGVEMTQEAFYARLAASQELPTTSQINPDAFQALFQKYVDQGDQVVGIFLSSKLSGTCQSAFIAKELVEGGEVYVVDSHTVTFALALLVEEAAAMRDRGRSAAEIAAAMEDLAQRVRLLAVVETLLYLKKGGRISAATAIVGGLLGINPIVGVTGEGTVEALGKARGMKAGFRQIAALIEKEPADPAYRVAYGHANAPAAMESCREAVETLLPCAAPVIGSIGAVVGTHAGPGAAGVAYIAAR